MIDSFYNIQLVIVLTPTQVQLYSLTSIKISQYGIGPTISHKHTHTNASYGEGWRVRMRIVTVGETNKIPIPDRTTPVHHQCGKRQQSRVCQELNLTKIQRSLLGHVLVSQQLITPLSNI